MGIQIIKNRINANQLREIAEQDFKTVVKGVVDLQNKTIALGGQLHADAESLMLQHGSKQEDLWGFNIRLDIPKDQRIEYTSFINIRPKQNNLSLEIQDLKLKEKIKMIIEGLVE